MATIEQTESDTFALASGILAPSLNFEQTAGFSLTEFEALWFDGAELLVDHPLRVRVTNPFNYVKISKGGAL